MNIKNISVSVLALLFFVILPVSASAATVYVESSRSSVSVGDTVIVAVKINAEGQTINTVEGEIATKSNTNTLLVKEFSLANSALGLWPRTPSLSKDGRVISFTGGVPGGFNIEGATLFKIIFEAKEKGDVTISPRNIQVFANDGKGTKIPVQFKDIVINVGDKKDGTPVNDDWQSVVAGDTTPPEDFIVVLGQEKSMFNGKKFAFFSALDNQSGISYYDVSENGAPAIRTGSVYVLQDQEKEVDLKVTAYDKAGNSKVANAPKEVNKIFGFSITFFIILILLVILKVVLKIRSKK